MIQFTWEYKNIPNITLYYKIKEFRAWEIEKTDPTAIQLYWTSVILDIYSDVALTKLVDTIVTTIGDNEDTGNIYGQIETKLLAAKFTWWVIM